MRVIGKKCIRIFITILPILFFSKGKSQNYIRTAEDFLYAVKMDDNPQAYIDTFATVSEEELYKNLTTENQKKAFWLNIYNAFVQLALKSNPEKFKNRNKFYKNKFIVIAGKKMSLDLIEHGIIRHSKNKYSLGYIQKVFVGKFEKKFRLKEVDMRIHFALNCGAKSCPAVAFYNEKDIDEQLNGAMKGYITSESIYNKEKNVVLIPVLFKWFRADFRGKKNVYSLLWKYAVIPENTKPKIKYLKYDWTLELERYK